MRPEHVERVLERVLRKQCPVDISAQQSELGHVCDGALFVQAHQTFDDDAEERLHQRRRHHPQDTRQRMEGESRRVREPDDDRLDGIQSRLVDLRRADHAVDGG